MQHESGTQFICGSAHTWGYGDEISRKMGVKWKSLTSAKGFSDSLPYLTLTFFFLKIYFLNRIIFRIIKYTATEAMIIIARGMFIAAS